MRDRAEIVAAERQLLRFFCVEASRTRASHPVWQKAGHYAWREPEHQAIYRALSALRLASPAEARAQLPVRLTRLGFPEVEWNELFEASELTPEQALQIISDLAEE